MDERLRHIEQRIKELMKQYNDINKVNLKLQINNRMLLSEKAGLLQSRKKMAGQIRSIIIQLKRIKEDRDE